MSQGPTEELFPGLIRLQALVQQLPLQLRDRGGRAPPQVPLLSRAQVPLREGFEVDQVRILVDRHLAVGAPCAMCPLNRLGSLQLDRFPVVRLALKELPPRLPGSPLGSPVTIF